MNYTVELTPLAAEIAKRHSTIDAVYAKVRAEIDSLLASGLKNIDMLFVHTVFLTPV